MNNYTCIDVPFNSRHTCWFCGEPCSDFLDFPANHRNVSDISHQPLAVPSCNECSSFKTTSGVKSIWALRDQIKHQLMSKYAKHLGIGLNWTETELKESDFTGSVLGGFGKSAWPMYQIAKERIAYKGWPITIDELPLDGYDETSGFTYDGTRYLSLHTCIDYYVKSLSLDKDLLTQAVDIVTPERFGYALKIAKLNKFISAQERSQILEELLLQESEAAEANLELEKQSRQCTVPHPNLKKSYY